jgi:actin cytoskeleton-regulatory complex protein PAN1
MALYLGLNGNEIPTVLPPELEPVSSKHLGESVDFLKDLLKNDTNIRATSSESRGKVHSFRDSPTPQVDPTKDGTIYKHDDAGVRGYTSGSRRIDRNAVRSGDSTPSDDLSDIKRQLASTNKRLDKAREEAESRTAEDDALDNELDDLKYRVRRVQDDIERVSRGPKSAAKDQERRRLERVLLELMHTKVPELEKKIEERDRRKQREEEEWTRDRDRRNDRRRGKYDSPSSPRSYRDEDEEEEPDRGYLRGTFNRDDERRDSGRRDSGRRSADQDDDRDRGYDRSRIRNRDRGNDRRSPPLPTRSPAPVPRKDSSSTPRPAAPVPSASPAPQTKSMTPDERAAFIRAQAQQRLQERMKALGVSGAPPSSSSPVDTSVEARLANERKEAEEKARKAEKDAEDREKLRQQRLEVERAARSPVAPVPPKATTPVTVPPVPKPVPPRPANKRAPRPPPPPRSSNSSNTGSVVPSVTSPRPPAPRVPTAPPVPVVSPAPVAPPVAEDEEERELRRRETARKEADRRRLARRAELEAAEEEARREAEEREIREREAAKEEADRLRATRRAELEAAEARREAEERERREREAAKEEAAKRRAARIAELEAAEAEARKEEEEYEKRMEVLRNAKLKVASSPSQNGHVAPVHATPPSAPPAPPAPAATPVPSPAVQTTNPFHKLSQQISVNTPSPGPGPAANPWSTTASETVSAAPAPPAPPAPPTPSVIPLPPPAPSAPSPPLVKTPTPVPTNPYSTPKSPYIPPPVDDWDDPVEKADSDSSDDEFVGRDARINIANAIFRGGSGTPAPSAPPPPKSPAPFKAPEGPPDRNALLSSIVGGAKLRPAKTNDRSSAAVAGSVIGDTAPPSHINTTARPVTPPTPGSGTDTVSGGRTPSQVSESRQSVDWYAGLASDGLPRSVSSSATHETPIDEEDEENLNSITIPDINVHGPTESAPSNSRDASNNLIADINTSVCKDMFTKLFVFWEVLISLIHSS